MTRLLKGNREIVVCDDEVAAYLDEGYAVIDNRGNVIAEGRAMDYGSALQRIAELEARNRSLAAALDTANARIRELEATQAAPKKTARKG